MSLISAYKLSSDITFDLGWKHVAARDSGDKEGPICRYRERVNFAIKMCVLASL